MGCMYVSSQNINKITQNSAIHTMHIPNVCNLQNFQVDQLVRVNLVDRLDQDSHCFQAIQLVLGDQLLLAGQAPRPLPSVLSLPVVPSNQMLQPGLGRHGDHLNLLLLGYRLHHEHQHDPENQDHHVHH